MKSDRSHFDGFLKFFLSISLCASAASCVATQSIMSGGNIQLVPVLHSGNFAPSATKKKDGSLLLTVYFETTKTPAYGERFKAAEHLKTEQKVMIVTQSKLQPAIRILKQKFPHYDPQMLTTMSAEPGSVSSSFAKKGSLKVIEGWPGNGSHFVCPSEECVIFDSDFIWYVPAKGRHSEAMAAIIPSPSRSEAPLKELPKKVALLPVGLLSDAFLDIWISVAILTGQGIDL